METKEAELQFRPQGINPPVEGMPVPAGLDWDMFVTGSQTTNSAGNAFFFNQPARTNYSFRIEMDTYIPMQDTFYLETDTTLNILLEKATMVYNSDSPGIIITPNPFNTFIHIEVQNESLLEVYDISGRLRASAKLWQGLNYFPAEELEKGGYFLKITNGENVFIRLIIK